MLTSSGTFAQHPERVRDHSIFAAFPVALPLWIPAFAGMTGVVQRSSSAGPISASKSGFAGYPQSTVAIDETKR